MPSISIQLPQSGSYAITYRSRCDISSIAYMTRNLILGILRGGGNGVTRNNFEYLKKNKYLLLFS